MTSVRGIARVVTAVAAVILLAPWWFFAYWIWALGYEGADCADQDLTSCGDAGTVPYAWGQAVAALIGTAALAAAASSVSIGSNPARGSRAVRLLGIGGGSLLLWGILLLVRLSTAGQVY